MAIPASEGQAAANGQAPGTPGRTGLGIVAYALSLHQRHAWAGRHAGLPPALAFLEECHRLGAGGLQVELGPNDTDHLEELRRRTEANGMFFEAILSLPRDPGQVARFATQVQSARTAGASVARAVIMPGRRYEQFKSLDEFRQAEAAGAKSLELAEPVLARHRFRLAVENHKDHRVAERLRLFERLSSEWIGACVDVGNNIALLEGPLETVSALAPWAMTVHLKDHAVGKYLRGFRLADMALGEGFLDLPAMIAILRRAKPGLRFQLETITRDALPIPVLTPDYWITFPDIPARDLGQMLALVEARASALPFAEISKLPIGGQLEAELGNVQRSLAYAHTKLNL